MRSRFVILILLIGLILGACSGTNNTSVTSTPVPTDTPISLPTLTATPTVPLAILVLPTDIDPDTADLYQKTVYDLAQASGFRFQVRNSLTVDDVKEPGLQIVIALPPDPGIVALAAAAPNVQFLSINIPGITAGGNVSVLGGNTQPELTGFIAGYIAALITDDYRIGMLMPKDNNDAIRAFNAYTNGMKLECGTCHPYYLLQWGFPQYLEIPSTEDKAAYNAYADILITKYNVRTIFVDAGIYTSDLVDYIGTTGTMIIGTISPDQLPAGWVVTIGANTIQGIQNAWPQLVAGQGGQPIQSPIGLSDIDSSVLSPGRMRLVNQLMDNLKSGFVSP